MSNPILELRDLSKTYPARGRSDGASTVTRAVDGVSFSVNRGDTVALVGQSGSGKTTTGRLILRLERPTSGSVLFEGVDLATAGAREMRAARKRLQMVFQDPYESLDPRSTIGSSIEEPLRELTKLNAKERKRRVGEALDLVEMRGGARGFANRYPHELSGGQRQRVAIARAIAVEPDFVVADEPVSMLDVSIRAGILDLLRRLQVENGISMLFVTHDLAVASHMADRVAVMYAGRVVEIGPADAVIRDPQHPYTQLLLSSMTRIERTGPPTPRATPSMPGASTLGCNFAPDCPIAVLACIQSRPALRAIEGREVACDVVAGAQH